DRGAAQKAVAGAAPTLLAGLADLVATPAGANQLSSGKLVLSRMSWAAPERRGWRKPDPVCCPDCSAVEPWTQWLRSLASVLGRATAVASPYSVCSGQSCWAP